MNIRDITIEGNGVLMVVIKDRLAMYWLMLYVIATVDFKWYLYLVPTAVVSTICSII